MNTFYVALIKQKATLSISSIRSCTHLFYACFQKTGTAVGHSFFFPISTVLETVYGIAK